jgi:hypothetical protein
MRISLDDIGDSGSATPAFRVQLLNSGDSDFVLNLGLMLANGDKQYPRAVVLIVTDGAGKSWQFELIEPAHIFGRADPLLVPLSAGSIFSIPVRLNKYFAVAPMELDYRFKAGAYFIEATFTGTSAEDFAIPGMPYWKDPSFRTSCDLRFRNSSFVRLLEDRRSLTCQLM